LLFAGLAAAQDIALYSQFNGRYDFVFAGNTMNLIENGANDPCNILTASSANLNLAPTDQIEAVYLYWAGSGTGDFDVRLNDTDIAATRTFSVILATTGMPFFSAFADVTSLVQTTGNGSYTLSNLDVSPWLNIVNYCNNGTNFAGWALVAVYKNDALPLNQLNVYDGLQNVPGVINITLDNLNVIDNDDAQIGFVAWEGDAFIANGETLSINGNPLSSLPLNPVNNAFNGTNSFTGSTQLYNMDLDVYNIQDNIAIGDTQATITLESAQDFVMVNAIVTKLNSQLPDATVSIDNVTRACDSRTITVDYTVYNVNSTNELEAGVPIRLYAENTFLDFDETTGIIPIGGSEPHTIELTIPEAVPDQFTLVIVVDDNGDGTGSVAELDETNNKATVAVDLLTSPEFNALEPVVACNEGFGSGTFDFSGQEDLVRVEPDDVVSFHETLLDCEQGTNAIQNTTAYHTDFTPMDIFVRIENESCHSVTSFPLVTRNCPPRVYNYVSANEDGTNDFFFVEGLRDIFLNFEIEIYNRWGVLIWTGNQNSEDWKGVATKGLRVGGNQVPDGTYYYVVYLNDPDYDEPLVGFLYLNR
jgi:gliding motility-associated-like protein